MVALVVLGSAAVAGSAVGKKDSVTPPGIIGPTVLPSHSNFDYALNVTSGSGASTGWIEIDSFSWGATQSATTSGSGGAEAGKATFQDLRITKHLDKASAEFAKDVSTGTVEKTVVLEAFAADKNGTQDHFLTLKLTDCIVTSYQVSGSGGGSDLPMEEITINFAKIEYTYSGSDALQSSMFGFDLSQNKAI